MVQRFIADVRKFWHYAYYSAKAELKAEVASSYLNWIWWVLEPLCFMLIYSLVFGVVFNTKEPHFQIFIFIGLTAWQFFSKCVQNSVKMIKANKALVTKVYLPKFILIISKMMVNGFKMLISFGIVVLMMLICRVQISLQILMFIPEMLTLFSVTFGVMTIMLHCGVYIDDLSNIVSIALRLLFYLTGIFYNIEKRLGGRAPDWVIQAWMKMNPMALVLSSLRNSLIYASPVEWKALAVWFLLGILMACFGIRKIYLNENSYAKVI